MKKLLFVSHEPSKNTQALSATIMNALAKEEDVGDIHSEKKTPFEVQAEDIIRSDGVLLFASENFGYMCGALKDMFDRCYYPCLEHTQGKPYGLIVRAGKDGTGATRSIETIITGLKWSKKQERLILKGEFQESFHQRVKEFSLTLAAAIEIGL